MKTASFLLSTLLLAGAAPLAAQEAGRSTIPQLIERLGDPNYDSRRDAEKELMARGKEALEALEKSAKESKDPEIQWRAGRLARRIQEGDGGARRPGLSKRNDKDPGIGKDGAKRGDELDSRRDSTGHPIDDVMRQIDRAFAGRGFDSDVQREIDRAMEQVRRSLRELDHGGGPTFGHGPDQQSVRGSAKSMKLTQGPDGVRVEVTEKGEDGKSKTKVYEAEDMQSFRRKYPGVLGNGFRVEIGDVFGDDFPGGRGFFRWMGPRLRGMPGLRDEDDANRPQEGPKTLRKKSDRDEAAPEQEAKPEGKRLGFYVGEISPAVRDYLDLEGGLMVQDVVPDSLAQKLGIQKGDIVVKVGDAKISSVADVAAALEKIGDGKVTVGVIRRGREITLGGS